MKGQPNHFFFFVPLVGSLLQELTGAEGSWDSIWDSQEQGAQEPVIVHHQLLLLRPLPLTLNDNNVSL